MNINNAKNVVTKQGGGQLKAKHKTRKIYKKETNYLVKRLRGRGDNSRVLGVLGEPLDAVTVEWRVWRTAGVVAGDDARPIRDHALAPPHQPVGALAVLGVADVARRPSFQPRAKPGAQPLRHRRMRLQKVRWDLLVDCRQGMCTSSF